MTLLRLATVAPFRGKVILVEGDILSTGPEGVGVGVLVGAEVGTAVGSEVRAGVGVNELPQTGGGSPSSVLPNVVTHVG